ncbi:amidase [Kordiimonas pumila]|uniref:Amidase n=1 Tax=Kordiimonas pumila TaxID=2161677 RepID=A0ABV7D3P7_9PROT|nr:amidase [Kordiimonas pumila]
MKPMFSRRSFLRSSGGAISGIAVTATLYAEEGLGRSKALSQPNDLRFTEQIFGLNYTDTERALVYDNVEALVNRMRTRREKAPLSNADTPAQTFDPRLPGEVYYQQENRVRVYSADAGPLPNDENIAYAPVWKQAAWLRAGKITAIRLTDIYLQRIQKYAANLECFVTVMKESARKEAYQADIELQNGKDRGPLHGIPYGLKDLADTAGVTTSWGATPYKDRVPTTDAVIVERLRAAGAVLLGKTTLGALAYGDLWFGGLTRNPWDLGEGSSGSSAGSAASTAAGLCSFAIGSETLGSIISPSGRCGATGLRPTFGRVPRTGAMALCWSLDKLGPICRYAEDTALVLSALNGAGTGDPSSFDWGFAYDGKTAAAEDMVIGYNPVWFEDATVSEVKVLTDLRDMGFTLQKIDLPDMPYDALLTTLDVESAAAFEELVLTNRDDTLKWQEPQAWPNTFRSAYFISAVEALQVDRFRRKVMEAMADVYRHVDLIVCPSFAADMVVITNFTGTPSLTLPIGMEMRQSTPLLNQPAPDPDRRKKPYPQAITLWGTMFREDQLIAVGRLLEEKYRFFEQNRPVLNTETTP